MRTRELLVLLCAAALASAGCSNQKIVRASPPSVITPPEEVKPPAQEPEPPIVVEIKPEPSPELPPAEQPPAPAKRPAPRPRPAQPESSDPAPAKPAPPQISPQLSARDLDAAKRNTTASITTAEKNMQASSGRQLSAAQSDLVGKIKGFLAQAHEAIVADDWVQAQNLAEKARILSLELAKSF